MFADEAKAYPIEVQFSFTSLGQIPGLAYKHLTGLKRPARDKHTSLLQTLDPGVCGLFFSSAEQI
jgi:hypothetical protein